MSYKVGVKTAGDKDWVFNALRFKTENEANAYGQRLWQKMTAVQTWAVFVSDELANVESLEETP